MATACLPLLFLPVLQLAQVAPDPATPQQEQAAEIYRALKERTNFEFVDKPLGEALSELSRQHGINVVLDARSLHRKGVDESTPVSLILNGVRLRSALNIICEDLGLDYTISESVLRIRSAEDVRTSTALQSYDVNALLVGVTGAGGDVESLAAAIREQIPESAEQTARISGYRNVLLVTGNRYVQERVQRTLRVLAKGLNNAAGPCKMVNPLPTY